MNNSPKRVIVGLSGGVDSSVAAILLQQQGYHVEGLFMKNWEEDDNDSHCPTAIDLKDAQLVADVLKIQLHTINFSEQYWDNVFEDFLNESKQGRTPNPDILCNREIKFKAFLEHALSLGADLIATGHYAQNVFSNGMFQLQKGLDPNKDQSYFLYTLGQKALEKSLFPVGALEKQKVRKIAEHAGLKNFNKKDSTGICFIGKRKFKTFLEQYIPAQPGNIETPDGNVVGTHEGLMFYTLGQRQGLKIGGNSNFSGEPWYVVAKDLTRNTLQVAQGEEHPLLYKTSLKARQLSWVGDKPLPEFDYRCSAKIRYRQQDEACTIFLTEHECQVTFDNPQRAVTPGQSVVFYQNNICLGGGIIQ